MTSEPSPREQAPSKPERTHASGLVVGKIKGAPVVLSWTMFVVAILLVYIYWSGSMAHNSTTLIMSIALVIALFASVFLHELAHGLVATAFHFRVKEYALTFWGGQTTYDVDKPKPGSSAAIAAAGPVMNILIFGVCYVVEFAFSTGGTLPDTPVWVTVGAIAWINVLLAGFNLIPANPLDGGTLVEALVWKISGRQSLGMMVSGVLGMIAAGGIVLYGFSGVLEGKQVTMSTALFSVVIGLFVAQGAVQSWRGGRVMDCMDKVVVAHMLRRAVVVPTGMSVADVDRTSAMEREQFGAPIEAVFTGDGGRITGCADPTAYQSVPRELRATTPISAVSMVLPAAVGQIGLHVGAAGQGVVHVAVQARAAGLRLIPVGDGQALVGFVYTDEVIGRSGLKI